ncbi:NAD(+)--dinitrogen-reductase ADP-D-ribosyltransferase [Amphritea pacifica]|uniref:NAD(+)--dinitrogen-reductase ADP-D-ribosyltransferase n=1 Tax=Amphritea pacifica TaxID=2811233 RepID=UPI00196607FD|nr:NAD(+)--dinitrogen-reductase ADP-D-ribosyltransferase [Amphritea pacifica]MBN1006934.1 hypothetical protein [Amphritea pacifica]
MADSPLELIQHIAPGEPTLPAYARLPVNHCNYPAIILGSLTFQRYPEAIFLDNVATFHQPLFNRLDNIEAAADRAVAFEAYMQASFLLSAPEEAGYQATERESDTLNAVRQNNKKARHKADYRRLLRGWLFDSDSREAAVMKGWVESRFGLLARNHKGPLRDFESDTYINYTQERSAGLYNTNSLESQLDLLYSYCQYELHRRLPNQRHYQLYRATNRLNEYDTLFQGSKSSSAVILNNLTSFSSNLEQCDSFGDTLLQCQVPFSKILFFPDLLPGAFRCESEYIVLGGLYQVSRVAI